MLQGPVITSDRSLIRPAPGVAQIPSSAKEPCQLTALVKMASTDTCGAGAGGEGGTSLCRCDHRGCGWNPLDLHMDRL